MLINWLKREGAAPGITIKFMHALSGIVILVSLVVPSFSQQPPSGEMGKFPVQAGGTYTDGRDHKIYPTVQIGNQIWFAENFAYLPSVDSPEVSVYGYHGGSVSEAQATESYQKYGWSLHLGGG